MSDKKQNTGAAAAAGKPTDAKGKKEEVKKDKDGLPVEELVSNQC